MDCPKCGKKMKRILNDEGLDLFRGQESYDCDTKGCVVGMVEVHVTKLSKRRGKNADK